MKNFLYFLINCKIPHLIYCTTVIVFYNNKSETDESRSCIALKMPLETAILFYVSN